MSAGMMPDAGTLASPAKPMASKEQVPSKTGGEGANRAPVATVAPHNPSVRAKRTVATADLDEAGPSTSAPPKPKAHRKSAPAAAVENPAESDPLVVAAREAMKPSTDPNLEMTFEEAKQKYADALYADLDHNTVYGVHYLVVPVHLTDYAKQLIEANRRNNRRAADDHQEAEDNGGSEDPPRVELVVSYQNDRDEEASEKYNMMLTGFLRVEGGDDGVFHFCEDVRTAEERLGIVPTRSSEKPKADTLMICFEGDADTGHCQSILFTQLKAWRSASALRMILNVGASGIEEWKTRNMCPPAHELDKPIWAGTASDERVSVVACVAG